MKKLLNIIFITLILSNSAFADPTENPSKNIDNYANNNDGFFKFVKAARYYCVQYDKQNNDFTVEKKTYPLCVSEMNDVIDKKWPGAEMYE